MIIIINRIKPMLGGVSTIIKESNWYLRDNLQDIKQVNKEENSKLRAQSCILEMYM